MDVYQRYFGKCPLVDIPSKVHPVEEFFLEDVLELTRYSTERMKKLTKSQASSSASSSSASHGVFGDQNVGSGGGGNDKHQGQVTGYSYSFYYIRAIYRSSGYLFWW